MPSGGQWLGIDWAPWRGGGGGLGRGLCAQHLFVGLAAAEQRRARLLLPRGPGGRGQLNAEELRGVPHEGLHGAARGRGQGAGVGVVADLRLRMEHAQFDGRGLELGDDGLGRGVGAGGRCAGGRPAAERRLPLDGRGRAPGIVDALRLCLCGLRTAPLHGHLHPVLAVPHDRDPLGFLQLILLDEVRPPAANDVLPPGQFAEQSGTGLLEQVCAGMGCDGEGGGGALDWVAEGCGGVWWGVVGCGGVWRGVEGCGGVWRGVEGCGGVWRGVEEGCGGM